MHTKRQVKNRAGGTALGCDVVDSPVETSQDARLGALGTLEDLDGNEVGL